MKKTILLFLMSLCVLSLPLDALTQNCEIDFTGKLLNSHVEQLYDVFYFYGEKEPRSYSGIYPDSNGDFEFLCLPQDKYWVVVMRSGCLWDSLGHCKSGRDTLFTFNSTLTDTAITLVEPCSYNEVEEKAKEDIKNGTAKLLIVGGISPTIIICLNEDGKEYYCNQDFLAEFGVGYLDFGCTPPPDERMLAYNRVVIQHLDENFGSKWREEVRSDVVGLK